MIAMSPQREHWPVDAHVHLHDARRAASALDAAARSFAALAGRCGGVLGALLLAQARRERVFEALLERRELSGWRLEPAAAEPHSLIARRGPDALVLVCGRQLRAQDGLEVLALGTRAELPDGLSLREALAAARGADALAVLPWGFGKWWGARGRRVRDALAGAAGEELFVGDNGGRLACAPPRGVRELAARGFRVLPGSDPFPFGADVRRVGSFGFWCEVEPSERAPWRDLRAWLLARPHSPVPFGHGCGPLRFARNQLGSQLVRRLPWSAAR
jgi:hypothetical protein